MKIAYIFSSTNSQKILTTMIIPQLEQKRHGVDVVGMFFFMDNAFYLMDNTETGKRLQALHEETGMVIMACDQCAIERGIENNLVTGAMIGCFPKLYALLGGVGVDQVITL
ncbi:MAG: hypothetical protein H6Q68_1722 [Firmicutes bacterium]|nr:hypothetical protein [Bacillota bacterium]